MTEEHYADEDVILPALNLASPCPIRIDIHEDRVSLSIGNRDWEWRRGCPDVIATGTFFNRPVAETCDDPEDGD